MKIWISTFSLLFVISILSFHAPRSNGFDDIPEDDPLVGKWTVKNAIRGGKERDDAIGYVYTFGADGQFTVFLPDGTKRLGGRFEIEGDGDVRNLLIESEEDQRSVGGGGPRLGIFKTYNNRRMKLQLQICVNTIGSDSGRPRPDSFDAPDGEYRELITLELND